MKSILFKTLWIVLAMAMIFVPQMAYATDYAAAGNPNAVAADPGDDLNLTDAGCIVTINNAVDIANSVDNTSGGDGVGTLTLSGTTTVTGTVGATNTLLAVNAGVAATTATFTGAVSATTLNVTGTGAVALNGGLTGALDYDNGGTGTVTVATGQDISGAVTATTAGQGTLTLAGTHTLGGAVGVVGANELADVNVNGGTTTTSSDIAATTIDIDATGTLALGADIATEGTIATAAAAGSTIDLNGHTLTHTGAITFGVDSDLNLEVASATSYGNIVSSGDVTIVATEDMAVNVTGYLADGTALTVINSSGGGGAVVAPTNVTDDSVMGSFAATAADTNQDLVLTYTRDNTYNSVATTANASAAGAALENAGATDATGDMLTVLGAMDTLGSTADVAAAVEQTTPDVSAAPVQTVLNALKQGVNVIANRLNGIRSGINTGATGVSYGDPDLENSIWAEGFGGFAKQSTRDGIEGYDSTIFGTTVGFDNSMGDNMTAGVAAGYAYTSVDSKRYNIGDTDINSFQGSLYGSYDQGPWFLDGVVSFAWNMYEGSRGINFAGINRTADSDYDGQQYSAYLAGGYTYDYNGLEITPMASLRYVYLYIDSYDETGAGALNLKVDDQDYNLLESGLGAKFAYPVETENLNFTPEVHAMWLYDFIGDNQQTTARFAGGGSSFGTNGADPAQHSLNAGAKITFELKDDLDLVLDYDIDIREDFYSHTGGATVKYYF